jgi:transcriptional regulator with XRE-family HTH domain
MLRALRGKIPVDDFARELGINLTTYYRYERGDTQVSDGHIKLAKIVSANRQLDKMVVSDPESDYDPHGGWRPRSIEELTGVPRGLGMGRAVEMLANIYQSKNQEVIRAINESLQVFSAAVEQALKIEALQRDVDELRAMVAKHAQRHAYYGQERRSGEDRRREGGQSPTGVERRSGDDRREPVNDCG